MVYNIDKLDLTVSEKLHKGNNFHPEILLIRNDLIFLHIKTYQKPVQGREREGNVFNDTRLQNYTLMPENGLSSKN